MESHLLYVISFHCDFITKARIKICNKYLYERVKSNITFEMKHDHESVKDVYRSMQEIPKEIYYLNQDWSQEDIEQKMSLFLVKDGTKIIGYAILMHFEKGINLGSDYDYIDFAYTYLEQIAVVKSYRKKNIGSYLLKFVSKKLNKPFIFQIGKEYMSQKIFMFFLKRSYILYRCDYTANCIVCILPSHMTLLNFVKKIKDHKLFGRDIPTILFEDKYYHDFYSLGIDKLDRDNATEEESDKCIEMIDELYNKYDYLRNIDIE